MGLINLLDKFHDALVEMYGRESYTQNIASTAYSFNGVKSIELLNMIPKELSHGYMSNGDPRSGGNRLGLPGEVTDAMQVLTLEEDLYWTDTIDSADNSQQGYLKKAGAYMKLMMRTKQNPYKDKKILAKWARMAGKVVELGNGVSLDKTNIIEKLCDVEEYYEDAGVPEEDRYVFLPVKCWTYIRLADEYDGCDNLKRDMTIKGWKGNFNTLHLIFVPNDYLPTHVALLAVQKDSVLAPSTFKHVKLYESAPGYVGPLMEYLEYFDAFVVGALNEGVYLVVDYGYKCGTLTITKANGTTANTKKATIAFSNSSQVGYGSATIYYTLDGTDPRWSKTRQTYSAAIDNLPVDTVVRAAAELPTSGLYWSNLVDLQLTA